ncbi:MAG: CPBP family intramembrane metalloprotease [SAR324 cluster bacterium]|nr:CPBP family intramembrane metalloprotease [SAR324 cluster bacterium]
MKPYGNSTSQTVFPGMGAWAIIALVALPILPHFLNDIYIVVLNETYLSRTPVNGNWTLQPGLAGKWLMWTLDFTVYLTLPVAALWFFLRKGWFSWEAFDFRTENLGRNAMLGLLLFAAIWMVAFIKAVYLDPLLRPLLPKYGYGGFFFQPRDGWLLFLLMSVYLGLAAGFLEEFLYRSFLIRSLERLGLPAVGAGAVSVIVFTGIHAVAGAPILVLSFAVGIVFTAIYLRTRNIVPLVAAHSAIDIFWASGYEDKFVGFLIKLPLFGG